MKKISLLLGLAAFGFASAQIPAGYYNGTDGLSGAALKTKLSAIISAGYVTKSYDNLYNGYPSTDTDKYSTGGYENDGTVLDMYSEDPNGKDPYNYNHGQKRCGNYSVEGDCYNREHVVPQSIFSEASPMVSDMHHIRPTDGKVNGMRSNYPFGKVGNASYTSKNGTKVGSTTSPGYSGTVAEPINEFKGDVARMVLYFATRYEDKLSGFKANQILSTTKFPGLQTWELNTLLLWHQQDPVSQFELDRNNATYLYQNNRNPYIDNPEFVTKVWGLSPLAVEDAGFSTKYKIYPNPVKSSSTITVQGNDLKQYDKAWIYNLVGQRVQEIDQPFKNGNTIQLKNLPKGIYILKTRELNTKFIVE
ncbi:endonuclease [Soonwooa buanensis]|nr:endonuclease [Soonwooa buanensis]